MNGAEIKAAAGRIAAAIGDQTDAGIPLQRAVGNQLRSIDVLLAQGVPIVRLAALMELEKRDGTKVDGTYLRKLIDRARDLRKGPGASLQGSAAAGTGGRPEDAEAAGGPPGPGGGGLLATVRAARGRSLDELMSGPKRPR